ncbi:MAG: hypothetical protein HY863_03365 [Chloroflexi bacterium]|nr:hypothetical protein [Chloroflexota bacterium]
MTDPLYFQWQNEFLLKTIYPMRLQKLKEFLIYYMEIDIWSQYKGKDIATLQSDVQAYKKAQELAKAQAFRDYAALLAYFKTADVHAAYAKFTPTDEAEIAEINKLHQLFITSWSRDIRGERTFVMGQIAYWLNHYNLLKDSIKSKKRQVSVMGLDHPKRDAEAKALALKENVTLPMVEHELAQLRAFDKTYEKVEKPKLEYYRLQKADPNFKTTEAEFLAAYAPVQTVTLQNLAQWKVDEYIASLEKKNQYELLDEIHQRFKKEPKRFPYWLQYMVVHFSGMRYASAHGSWADPKDLLIQLRLAEVAKENAKIADDLEIERQCKEKVALYEGTGGLNRPKLALAADKAWKDKVALHMLSVKANGPKTRRAGLAALKAEEVNYEFMSLTTDEALKKLESMQATFPKWAWKEIVKLTPLRVNHVKDLNWETLSPEETAERSSPQSNDLRMVMDAWITKHIGAWRDEHGRSHELIVSRAVCNETAEHIQHIRGHLPPGGLTPKPSWYQKNEADNKLPGETHPYYVKPTSAKDYTQGASIFWLRFVDKQPDQWQVAKPIATKNGVGLLDKGFIGRKPKDKNDIPWVYKPGDTTIRSRTYMDASKKKVTQQQWLRWIHEATVAEAAETADGPVIITYETALPGGDLGTSAVGIHKMPLAWHLSDGTEEAYNRSFVGYVPEGQVPLEHLQTMLDWNRILRKQVT